MITLYYFSGFTSNASSSSIFPLLLLLLLFLSLSRAHNARFLFSLWVCVTAHHSERRRDFVFVLVLFSDLKNPLWFFFFFLLQRLCVCVLWWMCVFFCVDLLFHSIFGCFFVCLFVFFTNSGDVSVCGFVFPKFFWLRFLFCFVSSTISVLFAAAHTPTLRVGGLPAPLFKRQFLRFSLSFLLVWFEFLVCFGWFALATQYFSAHG